MRPAPIFRDAAHAVRFWVPVDGTSICAMVADATLRCCFAPAQPHRSALWILHAHLDELDAMVRRKVAAGSIEPVILYESDFPIDAATFTGMSSGRGATQPATR